MASFCLGHSYFHGHKAQGKLLSIIQARMDKVHAGERNWSESYVRDSNKSCLRENLYLSAWWTEHLSRRIQDPGLWTPHPEEAWSNSKLQLPYSCGSGFVCDTNRSVFISETFVAFPSTSGLLKVCLLDTCPFLNLRGDLAVQSRSLCVCVYIYIYVKLIWKAALTWTLEWPVNLKILILVLNMCSYFWLNSKTIVLEERGLGFNFPSAL